jgi:hypothetical protein
VLRRQITEKSTDGRPAGLSQLERTSSEADAIAPHLLQLLRQELPKNPRWWRGHLMLAQVALELREHRLAYGSALALLELSKGSARSRVAELWHAKILNASGEYQTVVDRLSVCSEKNLTSPLLEEERAAALIGLERFDEAYQALKGVQPRSSSAESAFSYLSRKLFS